MMITIQYDDIASVIKEASLLIKERGDISEVMHNRGIDMNDLCEITNLASSLCKDVNDIKAMFIVAFDLGYRIAMRSIQ